MNLLNITPIVPIIYDNHHHGPWTTNHTKAWMAMLIVLFLLSVVCGVVEVVRGTRFKDFIRVDMNMFFLSYMILFCFYLILGLTLLGGLFVMVYKML
jgi:hypothetical protein